MSSDYPHRSDCACCSGNHTHLCGDCRLAFPCSCTQPEPELALLCRACGRKQREAMRIFDPQPRFKGYRPWINR